MLRNASLRWLNLPEPITAQSIFVVGTPPPTTDVNPSTIFSIGAESSTNNPYVDLFIRHSATDGVSFDGTKNPAPIGYCAFNGTYLGGGEAKTGFFTSDGIIPSPYILYGQYTEAQQFTYFLRRDAKTSDKYYCYRESISEVIVYNRALTDAEVQAVGYYLQKKYGITGKYVNTETAYARTQAADQVGDTFARLNGDIGSIPSGETAELRVYYGTTDGGTDATAWDTYDIVAADLTENATFQHITRQPLIINTTYYCRFAAYCGDTLTFAESGASFTTRPIDTPMLFRRTGPMYDTNNWNTASWVNMENLYRSIPGTITGDSISIPANDKYHAIDLLLTNNVTLKSIAAGHGGGGSAAFGEGGVIQICNGGEEEQTITLDSGSPSEPVLIESLGTRQLNIGRSTNDNMILDLKSPLNIARHVSQFGLVCINAKIIGGIRKRQHQSFAPTTPLSLACMSNWPTSRIPSSAMLSSTAKTRHTKINHSLFFTWGVVNPLIRAFSPPRMTACLEIHATA